MKKILLLTSLLAVIGTAQAQLPVWSDDFNDGTVDDWTLIDADNDTHNWTVGKAVSVDENTFEIGSFTDINVLGTYVMDLTTFAGYGIQNNWAISPEISLAVDGAPGFYYQGTFKLLINGQTAIGNGGRPSDLLFYASTNPDFSNVSGGSLEASFTFLGEISLENPNYTSIGPFPEQFEDYELDITSYIESLPSKDIPFYIAFVIKRNSNGNNPVYGYEVNTITLDASTLGTLSNPEIPGLLGLELQENPVCSRLLFNNARKLENAELQIYNVFGALVKEATYSTEGIEVSELSSGVYFAVLSTPSSQYSIKFIKK